MRNFWNRICCVYPCRHLQVHVSILTTFLWPDIAVYRLAYLYHLACQPVDVAAVQCTTIRDLVWPKTSLVHDSERSAWTDLPGRCSWSQQRYWQQSGGHWLNVMVEWFTVWAGANVYFQFGHWACQQPRQLVRLILCIVAGVWSVF